MIDITFIFPCRLHERYEKVLRTCIGSFITENPSHETVEFLIKVDSQDILTMSKVEEIKKLYPTLNLRCFVFGEWEKRNSINYFYSYLLLKRSITSKYIGFISDDMIFYSNVIKSVNEYLNQPYKVLVTKEHYSDTYPKTEYSKLEEINNPIFTENFPIISTKIIDNCDVTMFYDIDTYFSFLLTILKQKYGINVCSIIPSWGRREGSWVPYRDPRNEFSCGETNATNLPKTLLNYVEQHAKNIYLNMKNDRII